MHLAASIGRDERIAAVEITMRVGGNDLSFGPKVTTLSGTTAIRGMVRMRSAVGLQLASADR